MRICISTANFGQIDHDDRAHQVQSVPAGWTVDYRIFDERVMPARTQAMHPRLQAKIPRCLGHELSPGYDYYVWIDGSIVLTHSLSLLWLVSHCESHDIALLCHPHRSSISSELAYCQSLMASGDARALARYANEPMEEQVRCYLADPTFRDEWLFATGVFAYSRGLIDGPRGSLMSDWFYHCARHSVQDQLSLPYLLHRHGVVFRAIDMDIFNNPYFRYVGHRP